MGEIADQLVEDYIDSFDGSSHKNRRHKKFKRTWWGHLTPSERKIASIRKEIVILKEQLVAKGVCANKAIHDARAVMNKKYGHSWRTRGLVINDENQWSEEELKEFI